MCPLGVTGRDTPRTHRNTRSRTDLTVFSYNDCDFHVIDYYHRRRELPVVSYKCTTLEQSLVCRFEDGRSLLVNVHKVNNDVMFSRTLKSLNNNGKSIRLSKTLTQSLSLSCVPLPNRDGVVRALEYPSGVPFQNSPHSVVDSRS